MEHGRIIILADGDWSDSDSLRELAESATFVIAADGGHSRALERGWPVDEVVGDLDSVSPELRQRLLTGDGPAVHSYPEDKDWTDLELAIERALDRAPEEIVVLGALGQRIDHTLANLQLLELGIGRGVPIVLATDSETVRLADGMLALANARIGDRVSLIPQTKSAVVSTSGLKFALDHATLQRAASRGISNAVSATPVAIDVHEGQLFVIHTLKERGGG